MKRKKRNRGEGKKEVNTVSILGDLALSSRIEKCRAPPTITSLPVPCTCCLFPLALGQCIQGRGLYTVAGGFEVDCTWSTLLWFHIYTRRHALFRTFVLIGLTRLAAISAINAQ